MGNTGHGETFLFWIGSIISVAGALGLIFSKKIVHAALCLCTVMLCLAFFYMAQGAVFLGVVQIVVYTGAVMMLFLFVLMLVGVDASDSLVETIRGQRVAAVALSIGFGAILLGALGHAVTDQVIGFDNVVTADGGNVEAIAQFIFGRFVYAFELTSALLITAAMGAMVLAHRERVHARPTQREMSERRFNTVGARATPLPAPGVYARHNAVDTPGLLPDGSPAHESVPGPLLATGVERTFTTADGRTVSTPVPDETVTKAITESAPIQEDGE
jgi:NADH-quinone oxidoreductase subunit J